MNAIIAFSTGHVAEMPLIRNDPVRHGFDRQHIINQPGIVSAFRHPGHCMLVILGLSKCQAAMFLNRCQAEGAVAAGSGKNDANRIFTLVFGERLEKCIDWAAVVAGRRGSNDFDATAANCHCCIRRYHENTVWFNRNAVGRFLYNHAGRLSDQLCQHAFVIGR